jgi:ATP-dependent Clp protease ATP-binding subunit ClpC
MSEYMEKFAISRLVGAPPGYVGYEGRTINRESTQKTILCCVLDEIEKHT